MKKKNNSTGYATKPKFGIGKVIFNFRKQQKISRDEAAKRMGEYKGTIRAVEEGRIIPHYNWVVRFFRFVFGINVPTQANTNKNSWEK